MIDEDLLAATEFAERYDLGYHLGSTIEKVFAARRGGPGGAQAAREAIVLITRYAELDLPVLPVQEAIGPVPSWLQQPPREVDLPPDEPERRAWPGWARNLLEMFVQVIVVLIVLIIIYLLYWAATAI